MAGHKISGYISRLWQALFAALSQLFAHIFRFTSSSPQAKDQDKDKDEDKTKGKVVSSSSPKLQSAVLRPPAASSLSPSFEANRDSSQQTPDAHSRQQIQQSSAETPDLERGTYDPLSDEEMPGFKKRGGQRRTGGKPNANPAFASANQYRDQENIHPDKLTDQSAPSSGNVATRTLPLGTSAAQLGRNDSKGSAKQHFEGGRSSGPGAHGQDGVQMPVALPFVDHTESRGPASGRSTFKPSGTLASASTATASAVDLATIQRPGSYSQAGTPDVNVAETTKSTEMLAPIDTRSDRVASDMKQLAIDDSPAHSKGEGLTKDTAAIEAAAIPTLVTVPLPQQNAQAALKPLAPLVTPPSQVLPGLIEPTTEEGKREREHHLGFMREALGMGELALKINETPVGCVLVYRGRTIAKGMNATNVTRNGTRHAEFMALSALLSHQPEADVKDDHSTLDESLWGDVDPSDGHIYPYGQKLHPSPKVNRSIISECTLYVTVEPCVMCASLLRQLGVKNVYFGAVNDKFGGTGGVFRIHVNSKPVPLPADDRPYQNGYGPHDADRVVKGRAMPLPRDEEDGDGGNVEPGYPAEGGYLRDEAVSLLRRFYVQENGRAPQPRKKEGRAARLFAMESTTNGAASPDISDGMASQEAPVDAEVVSGNRGRLSGANKAVVEG